MPLIVFFVGMVLFTIAVGLVLSLPVMLLWNWCLVPAIPGINELTWLQAWGILVLSNFLFKMKLSKNKD